MLRPKIFILYLLFICSLVGASCGSDTLTMLNYYVELEAAAFLSTTTLLDTIGSRDNLYGNGTDQELAEDYLEISEVAIAIELQLLDDLRGLSPPKDLTNLHEAYLSGVSTMLAARRSNLDNLHIRIGDVTAVEAGTPTFWPQVTADARLGPYQNGQRGTAACSAILDIAEQNDLSVGIKCLKGLFLTTLIEPPVNAAMRRLDIRVPYS